MRQQMLERELANTRDELQRHRVQLLCTEHRVSVLEGALSMLYSDVWMDDNYKAKIAIILAGGDEAASVEKEVLNR